MASDQFRQPSLKELRKIRASIKAHIRHQKKKETLRHEIGELQQEFMQLRYGGTDLRRGKKV